MFAFRKYQNNLTPLRERLHALLQEEPQVFDLTWELETVVVQRGRVEATHGLDDAPEIRVYSGKAARDALTYGLVLIRLETTGEPLRVVRIYFEGTTYWAIARREITRLAAYLEGLHADITREEPPVLSAEDQKLLLDNTVGYLGRSDELLKKYRVPKKRGVLLRGEPGNGKTMACRWLRYVAQQAGFDFTTVSFSNYAQARGRHQTQALFQTERPGIVQFDDFDEALKLTPEGRTTVQTDFLTQLDGMAPKHGVVYLFTSNLELDEIDPAAQRPGRIDVMIHFPNPSVALRRRFVREHWPEEVRTLIGEERIVADTDGWTFAELEEVRKCAVLRWVDDGDVDWRRLCEPIRGRKVVSRKIRPVGFHTATKADGYAGPAAAGTA